MTKPVDEQHAKELAMVAAYAAKSPKHAAWVARYVGLYGDGPSATSALVREITPKRRHTESREINGYAVDRGEDN